MISGSLLINFLTLLCTTGLGLFSLLKDWKAHGHPLRQYSVVVLLSGAFLVGSINLWVSNAKTQRSNQQLVDTLRNLKDSTVDIERMTALNNQLQDKLLKQSDAIQELSKQGIDATTGGNSFCYVTVSPVENKFMLFLSSTGKFPLHGVTVQMTDVDMMKQVVAGRPTIGWEDLGKYMLDFPPIPFLAFGSGRTLTFIPMPPTDSRNLGFNFSSLNGNWGEVLKLRRVRGSWEQAIKVSKMVKLNVYKTMYSYVSPNYPKTSGSVDWEN